MFCRSQRGLVSFIVKSGVMRGEDLTASVGLAGEEVAAGRGLPGDSQDDEGEVVGLFGAGGEVDGGFADPSNRLAGRAAPA